MIFSICGIKVLVRLDGGEWIINSSGVNDSSTSTMNESLNLKILDEDVMYNLLVVQKEFHTDYE